MSEDVAGSRRHSIPAPLNGTRVEFPTWPLNWTCGNWCSTGSQPAFEPCSPPSLVVTICVARSDLRRISGDAGLGRARSVRADESRHGSPRHRLAAGSPAGGNAAVSGCWVDRAEADTSSGSGISGRDYRRRRTNREPRRCNQRTDSGFASAIEPGIGYDAADGDT